MYKTLPLLFVVLWSSAFITSKIIVQSSSPFAALTLRFTIVTIGFAIYAIYKKHKLLNSFKEMMLACLTGILFHGLYLGGVFFSISKGLPSGVAALIVCLQPILTGSLAGPLLGELVSWRQWVGILLGFIGTFLVLGFDIGGNLPLIGIISSFISLIAVTGGTLIQKKISGNLSLPINNMYQAASGSIFLFFVMLFTENSFIIFSVDFILAMSWQIFFVSFGAFSILMYLIKNGSASKTSALFFLIPPVSAFMAWLFLDENLTYIDILGLLIATIGVYIATRKNT